VALFWLFITCSWRGSTRLLNMNIATQPPVFLRKDEVCSHYRHTCHLSVLPHSTRLLTYPSIHPSIYYMCHSYLSIRKEIAFCTTTVILLYKGLLLITEFHASFVNHWTIKIKVDSSDFTGTCRDDYSTIEGINLWRWGHSAKDALKHQNAFFAAQCVLTSSASW
jgi:hypothetical protein